MNDNITAVILSGGKNTRMGSNKAFLEIETKPIIEILIEKLNALFADVIIIANNPERYADYQVKVYPDLIPNSGPLGGIYTGLRESNSIYNFIIACDMPFVNRDLMKYITNIKDDNDCVIPRWNRKLEPLFGIYSKKCLSHIKLQLEEGDLKTARLFSKVKTRVIPEEEIKRFDSEGTSFTNINTKQDYQDVLRESLISQSGFRIGAL